MKVGRHVDGQEDRQSCSQQSDRARKKRIDRRRTARGEQTTELARELSTLRQARLAVVSREGSRDPRVRRRWHLPQPRQRAQIPATRAVVGETQSV